MQTIVILGRQPALGIAELESCFGSQVIQKLGSQAALLDVEPSKVDISRLGGTLKICSLTGSISTTEWPHIIKHLSATLPKTLQHIPSGKITIGLSLYGFNISPSKINAGALTLKKGLKSADRGVRIVPNKQAELNAAQVIHNQLTKQNGQEIVLIKTGKRTVVAHTIAVQDIDAYAARDQARPARDARVGMLPPKLAQIIINLAVDGSSHSTLNILDPFCGTGVVLQEAHLMGLTPKGTDLDQRMVEYSAQNLRWLLGSNDILPITVSAGDATTHTWEPFDAIACETYLGRPLSSLPSPEKLREIINDVDTIHKRFLRNVSHQTKPGFRMCIAVPAWKTGNSFKHLPILDRLTDLGYTRVSFVHAANEELIYHRPNQLVARELVTLIRK